MKLDLTRDGVTVEAGRADADLARATADALDGAIDLANAIGVRECDWCHDRGRLRPYNLIVDGEFQVLDICADCQREHVENAAANHRDGGDKLHVDVDDSESDPEDSDTDDEMPPGLEGLDPDHVREVLDGLDPEDIGGGEDG